MYDVWCMIYDAPDVRCFAHHPRPPARPSINYNTVRDMDKSGRGFLKNEEVYGMKKDQLQMQKDLFKMKKVIAGYVHIARSCLISLSLSVFI